MLSTTSPTFGIDHLIDTKANTVIRKLKSHFARQGVTEVVISDNCPEFAREQFTIFANQWGFEHRPGRPGHQQTNRKAEAAIKQAKRLLPKARDQRRSPPGTLGNAKHTH